MYGKPQICLVTSNYLKWTDHVDAVVSNATSPVLIQGFELAESKRSMLWMIDHTSYIRSLPDLHSNSTFNAEVQNMQHNGSAITYGLAVCHPELNAAPKHLLNFGHYRDVS